MPCGRQTWDVPYDDLLQEGRIALWQQVLHFDPHRGVAFSTYAWVAIQRRIWRAVTQANRPQGRLSLPEPPDPLEAAAAAWWMAQVHPALAEALACLPERLREVIVATTGWARIRPVAWPPSVAAWGSVGSGCASGATMPWFCCVCRFSQLACAVCVTRTAAPPTPEPRLSIIPGCGNGGEGGGDEYRLGPCRGRALS